MSNLEDGSSDCLVEGDSRALRGSTCLLSSMYHKCAGISILRFDSLSLEAKTDFVSAFAHAGKELLGGS